MQAARAAARGGQAGQDSRTGEAGLARTRNCELPEEILGNSIFAKMEL